MIKAYAVQNFKCLSQIPEKEGDFLRFGPLNVLIGPNGCGKSTLLQSIDFLRAFFRTSVEVYLKEQGWDYRDLPNLRTSEKSIRWEFKADLDPDEQGFGGGEYHYIVSLQPRKNLAVGEELLEWTPMEKETSQLLHRKGRVCSMLNHLTGETDRSELFNLPASVMSGLDSSRDRAKYPHLIHFRNWIERFRSYLIWDPKILRNPDRGRNEELGPSGEHLASVLNRMSGSDQERLLKRLKRLFPTLSDISVSNTRWGWRSIKFHEVLGDRKIIFNSQQMSDGILRLLTVTCMLFQKHLPPVITFEEPENGIHPQLLREVVQVLRELTLRKPPNRCQVFLTTHNPYVLDEFYDHPEEVYCVERLQDTETRVIRLSDKGELNIARDTFNHSLGEAWFSGLLGANAK